MEMEKNKFAVGNISSQRHSEVTASTAIEVERNVEKREWAEMQRTICQHACHSSDKLTSSMSLIVWTNRMKLLSDQLFFSNHQFPYSEGNSRETRLCQASLFQFAIYTFKLHFGSLKEKGPQHGEFRLLQVGLSGKEPTSLCTAWHQNAYSFHSDCVCVGAI